MTDLRLCLARSMKSGAGPPPSHSRQAIRTILSPRLTTSPPLGASRGRRRTQGGTWLPRDQSSFTQGEVGDLLQSGFSKQRTIRRTGENPSQRRASNRLFYRNSKTSTGNSSERIRIFTVRRRKHQGSRNLTPAVSCLQFNPGTFLGRIFAKAGTVLSFDVMSLSIPNANPCPKLLLI